MSNIMLIEEDSAMRVLISEWLASAGHKVLALARQDHQAAGIADAARLDLVILDLPAPRTLASAAARAVQAVQAAYPQAAMIGISAQLTRSLGADSDVSRQLGVSRLLAKPCSREELLSAVTQTLSP